MRVVNFAEGYTMEKPPMTSGAVQEEFPFLNNMEVWTELEGYSFDKNEVSSASVIMEISRKVTYGLAEVLYRQKVSFEVMHNGTEWQMSQGNYSGEKLWKDENEWPYNDQDIQFKIDPVTGATYYKSQYLVVDTHEALFKMATIRMKA